MNEALQTTLRRADVEAAGMFTADEAAAWPACAICNLVRAGLLQETEPAKEVLCLECEKGCWIKPSTSIGKRSGSNQTT